jgi:hypothetical protein
VRLWELVLYLTHRNKPTQQGADMEFKVNQIVKAKFGQFIILGFRSIDGEQYAQVKEYCKVTCKARKGEMSLPVASLTAI